MEKCLSMYNIVHTKTGHKLVFRMILQSIFREHLVFLNGPNRDSFLFIFVLFSHCKDKYNTNLIINDKAWMVCLGVEPGAAGWKAQTNPLSYGGTPTACLITAPM